MKRNPSGLAEAAAFYTIEAVLTVRDLVLSKHAIAMDADGKR